MPRLIHLNGPSRVGKSTLARRFADDRPGTLVLDLDVIVGLVGGWSSDFSAALEVARTLGRQMAIAHLRSGRDVIVPQLVTVHDQGPDPAFERSADDASASYVQIALTVDHDEHLRRLRGKRLVTEVDTTIQALLDDPARDLVGAIDGHLAEYLSMRPHITRLDTTGLDEDETYRRLCQVVDEAQR